MTACPSKFVKMVRIPAYKLLLESFDVVARKEGLIPKAKH